MRNTFRGGVHPEERKELSREARLRLFNPKGEMVFPLQQHIGKPAKPLVQRGDEVLTGQKIAEADGFVSSHIHSSCSGKVKGIEKRRLLSGGYADCIVVENDGQFTPFADYSEKDNAGNLSNNEILQRVQDAGIVGLGGAGFPTHVKLRPKDPDAINFIIANGAAILDGDRAPLREWLLDDADARRVYDLLCTFDVQINGYGRGVLYCLNTRALKRRSSMIAGYIGGQGHRLVLEDRAAFESEGLRGAYKLEALSEDPEIIAGVQAALKGSGLSVTHSSPRNVEIMAPGVNKGAALCWLAAHLGIPMEACMAFGDNMNEYDLLASAGWTGMTGRGYTVSVASLDSV